MRSARLRSRQPHGARSVQGHSGGGGSHDSARLTLRTCSHAECHTRRRQTRKSGWRLESRAQCDRSSAERRAMRCQRRKCTSPKGSRLPSERARQSVLARMQTLVHARGSDCWRGGGSGTVTVLRACAGVCTRGGKAAMRWSRAGECLRSIRYESNHRARSVAGATGGRKVTEFELYSTGRCSARLPSNP